MFTNKHVIVAMIVTPILAVLAWIAVGQFAGEKPHSAVPGQSYPMVEKSNCRYASGACDLENEDFRLRLTLDEVRSQLVLSASHPLEGALLSVAQPQAQAAPMQMQPAGEDGLEWRLPVRQIPSAGERIRLVARASGSTYFADAATAFMASEEK